MGRGAAQITLMFFSTRALEGALLSARTLEGSRVRRSRQVGVCVVLLMLGGCLVDEGQCSPNQELTAAGSCVCKLGYVPDDRQVCQPCGEHALSKGDMCECEPGFARNAENACELQSPGLGLSCSLDEQCQSDAPYCHAQDSGGYCTTRDCELPEDCAAGYACDTAALPSICRKAPSGLGDSCQTHDDCAGKEAAHCETNRTHTCMVSGCTSDAGCFIGYDCCDLTSFGLPMLCVMQGNCPVKR